MLIGIGEGMTRIIVQPARKNFEQFLDLSNEYNTGFEVVELARPAVLNDTVRYLELENFYERSLNNFENFITFHGAFIDLRLDSPDRLIRLASIKRVRQSIESAKKLNAERVVFHTGYNPVIRNEYYRQNYLAKSTEFWKNMIDEYDIEISLENMWDEGPELLEILAYNINDNRFTMCFDTGHFNVFSNAKLGSWLKTLSREIKHYHFNDNFGDKDSHLAIGKGTFDWLKLSDYMQVFTPIVDIVIEVAEIEDIKYSLEYLKKNKIFPFQKYRYENYDEVF